MTSDDEISITLPSGVSLSFDAGMPGLSLSLLGDALKFGDDGKQAHVRWQRVPRRALLQHLYDTLSLHNIATTPPLAAALAAWDELHPTSPSNNIVALNQHHLHPGGEVSMTDSRPLDLDEPSSTGLASLLVRSETAAYVNHVWAICGALKFPMVHFERYHLHIATELLEYFTRNSANNNNMWPHAFRHPFVRSYRYRGVVVPLLV